MSLPIALSAWSRSMARTQVFLALATLLQLFPMPAAAQPAESESAVEYLHVDALGSIRVVTDQQGAVISRHDYLPFGEEVPVASRTGLAGYETALIPATPQRFTGKERDNETGLDYFGARYYASSMGRFASSDAPFADQEIGDPQSWNLYTYAGNSPYVFVDEDGNIKLLVAVVKAVVKGGDIYSTVSGVVEAAGKVFSADPSVGTKDRLIATASLVGEISGASDLLKGGKAIANSMDTVKVAGNVGDGAKALEAVADGAKAAKGGESSAAKAGRAAHEKFKEKVKAKADDGWQSEPRLVGPDGNTLVPDALSPDGRPVELKPNTRSGRAQGRRQLKKYEEAAGKKGRVVYYEPI